MSITTTKGNSFTFEESVTLARLVYKRFGNDLEAAAAAWSRLLQNNTSPVVFRHLIEDVYGEKR